MYHEMRWTVKKIDQRIQLVDSLVHRRTQPIGPFRYKECRRRSLTDWLRPMYRLLLTWTTATGRRSQPIPTGASATPTSSCAPSSPYPPAGRQTDRSRLYLPLGEPGDFSHPEALAYVDGVSFAACDRHHQEIPLPPELSDGASTSSRCMAGPAWSRVLHVRG